MGPRSAPTVGGFEPITGGLADSLLPSDPSRFVEPGEQTLLGSMVSGLSVDSRCGRSNEQLSVAGRPRSEGRGRTESTGTAVLSDWGGPAPGGSLASSGWGGPERGLSIASSNWPDPVADGDVGRSVNNRYPSSFDG